MSDSYAFVGDLHGRVDQVGSVLRAFGGTRTMIFLGDYVNRGPDSRRVLQTLIAAQRLWPESLLFLRGNHDQALLDFYETGDIGGFARMGGLATLASYTGMPTGDVHEAFKEAMPARHLIFLEGLQDFFEDDSIFASHCGPDPSRLSSRDRCDVALSSHRELFQADLRALGKTVVCGHYVQRGMRPHVSDSLVAIDTGYGSVAGAPLSVFLWPERQVLGFGGDQC
jgi:serine/threonine protein phosphatase 1